MPRRPGWIRGARALLLALALGACAKAPTPLGPFAPIDPAALAVGPNGHLYVADRFRNQILEMHPDGTFTVFAGSGASGYAGDGGAAKRAALGRPNGMTFAPGGTLIFADSHNLRVRAISADGTIATVAGSGRSDSCPSIGDGALATGTSLGNPADVAIGPDGLAYLAVSCNNQILRLNSDGSLSRIAGTTGETAKNQGLFGVGQPATEASPDGPLAIEFDAGGNLYIFGFNTKALLMIDREGILKSIDEDGFYPRGSGGMARTPDGGVAATNELKLERLAPGGVTEIVDFGSLEPRGMKNLLPVGLAAAPDGSLFVSAIENFGSGPGVAIIRVPPNAPPEVIWSRRAPIRS